MKENLMSKNSKNTSELKSTGEDLNLNLSITKYDTLNILTNVTFKRLPRRTTYAKD